MKLSHCSSCGAEIYWLNHFRTSRRAPINAAVDPAGNILIDEQHQTYSTIHNEERPALLAQHAQLHTNHFMTCKQAATWHKHGSRNDTRRSA